MNPSANFGEHSGHSGGPGFWDLAAATTASTNSGISGGAPVEYGPLWEHHSAGYHSELLAAGYPVTPELWATSSSVRPPCMIQQRCCTVVVVVVVVVLASYIDLLCRPQVKEACRLRWVRAIPWILLFANSHHSHVRLIDCIKASPMTNSDISNSSDTYLVPRVLSTYLTLPLGSHRPSASWTQDFQKRDSSSPVCLVVVPIAALAEW
ncbi:hypothetical protein M8J77_001744 [Diaphorina citri]|nr:hypothetical protein M8J77_001744 [Diaphorina citri]